MPEQQQRLPENLTVINFAGGCVDYRLRLEEPVKLNGKCVVETWHQDTSENPKPYEPMIHDTERDMKFNTTAEAWGWIGEQLTLAPKRKFLVVDCAFNQTNYPALIGKLYDTPPSYVVVEVITPGSFIPPEERSDVLVPNT